MNYGLRQHKPRPKDWIAGGVSGITAKPLVDVAHWVKYVGIAEYQFGPYGDMMSCVSFSGANCCEIIIKFLTGIEINISDRFTAKMSGTTRQGNWYYKVGDSFVDDGIVEEKAWPFDRSMSGKVTWDKYYAEIPESIIKLGLLSKSKYKINYEFVYSDDLDEALRYGPLQVGVQAWTRQVNGIYQQRLRKANHAVTLLGRDKDNNWLIFDHYDKIIKKFVSNYKFDGVVRYSVTINPNNAMPKYQDNLLTRNHGTGEIGLTLDGKLMVGDLAEIHVTWDLRNNGDTAGKTLNLLPEDWDALAKMNLKKEAV